ncbi:hypothetical protein FIBSPDRAFT_742513 [Athelia psychrophila]|uniref:Uncharacterized protein n=1 Tax=Athelia psychrophila TaxID=1759441 RepID=A0A166J0G0_9AGAM|nr:hypothetical protein FIBSPDRAFT_742513 [Fibularhizoctonia sp. CBS 109695]
MARCIHLLVFNSPLFPAHWAMYIPGHRGGPGKLINVQGDPSTGFCHEFERNYDPSSTANKTTMLHLCDVQDEHVLDVPGDGSPSIDTNVMDDIERVALGVRPPPKTLRSSNGNAVPTKVTIQNCQTWMVQLVEALVEVAIVPRIALEVLEGAPKN